MARHADRVILVRQSNAYRKGSPVEDASEENWENPCGGLYIEQITLDRPTQTVTVEPVDEGDNNPDFRYRIGLGTWTNTADFEGVQPGSYDVFVENQNTGCRVHGEIMVIACDLTIDRFVYDEEYYQLSNGFIEAEVSTRSDSPIEVDFNGTGFVSRESRVFRAEGLEAGTYSITIKDEWGCTVSNEITLINVEDTESPTAPTNLSSRDVQEGEALEINWDKSEDEQTWVIKYRVYRSTTQGFTPSQQNLYQDDINGGINTTSNDTEWEDPVWVDEGVQDGTTYYYRLTAWDARGNESAPSEELTVTFTDDVQPDPPTALQTTSGNTQATIEWQPSPTGDVQNHHLYRSTDGESWTEEAVVSGSSYTDTGLTNGVTYHYYVTAKDEAENESVVSNTEPVIPADVTPPATPSVDASVAEDVEEVDLSISIPDTDDLQAYRIYRTEETEDGITGYTQIKQIDTQSGTATWTDTEVDFDQTYYYKVTSIDEVPNESSLSTKATATPFPDRTAPAIPSISGEQKFFGENQIALDVTIPDATDLEGYNIYRAPTSEGPYTLIKKIKTRDPSASYTDNETELSETYYYVVSSFDEGPNLPDSEPNESGYSTEISVTPEPVPQDQSVKITLEAGTLGENPGVLGFGLSGLADTLFWNHVRTDGEDLRVRRGDGSAVPMTLLDWSYEDRQGRVLFSDPQFDPTQEQVYFLWYDDPDNTGREGTPHSKENMADNVYQTLDDVQILMLDGEMENKVSDKTGITLHHQRTAPGSWQKATFQNTSNPGSITSNGGQSWTFEAGGDDIWDNTSHGEYLFKPIEGDVTVTAKVIKQDDTDKWAKCGPYLTSDVYERAPLAATLMSPDDGMFGDIRTTPNGNNTHSGGDKRDFDPSPQSTSEDPVWLRIERAGGQITYSYSFDGESFTELGTTKDHLPERIAAGFAATSHNTNSLCTVEVRELSVQGTEGNFMFGDDQVVALDGIHFDPANSDTIPAMYCSVLMEPRVFSNQKEGMIFSFDRNEYFRLSAPDSYTNRYGFDSHHDGNQQDSQNMDNYDFDQSREALLQFMFDKDRGGNEKQKWMNNQRDDRQYPTSPMIGSNKRFGLFGANSESAAFEDENWFNRPFHHIYKWFLWTLGPYSTTRRRAEDKMLRQSPDGLWDYPIIYLYIDIENPTLEFKRLLARQKENGLYIDVPSPQLHQQVFLGKPTQRDILTVEDTTTTFFAPPTTTSNTGLSAQLESMVEYNMATLGGADTIRFFRSQTKQGSYTKVHSQSVTSPEGSWIDTGLSPKTTYYYKTQAVKSNGDTSLALSKPVAVRTGFGNAINLKDVTVTKATDGSKDMAINASSSNGGLEYNLDGGAWQTSNTFTGINENQTYTIGVRDAAGDNISVDVDIGFIATGYQPGNYSLNASKDLSSIFNNKINGTAIGDNGHLYVTDYNIDQIIQLDITGGVGSATEVGRRSTNDSYGAGMVITPDGTKLYMFEDGGDDMVEFTMSTAFDITTASQTRHTYINNVLDPWPNHASMAYGPDGKKLYTINSQNNVLHEYNLSTAWDVFTASHVQNRTMSQFSSSSGIGITKGGMIIGSQYLYKQEGEGATGFVYQGKLSSGSLRKPSSSQGGERILGFNGNTLEEYTSSASATEKVWNDERPKAPNVSRTYDKNAQTYTVKGDTDEIDITAVEIFRKSDSETTYSLIDTVNYPVPPFEYTDTGYDPTAGHKYKARLVDTAGQKSPKSRTLKDFIIWDFEDDAEGFTFNGDQFQRQSNRVYEGSHAIGCSDSYIYSTPMAERSFPLAQPSSISWYWLETSSQYGSATHFYNSNGNLEFAIGTENPQWNLWDGDGDNDEIYGGDGYERWIKTEVTSFDWTNGTYSYRLEDRQSGHVETGTRSLKHGVDIDKIWLHDKPGNENRLMTWWDKFTIE